MYFFKKPLNYCVHAELIWFLVVSFRATIEERYAKDLQSLSKKVCGHNEMK